MCLHVLSTVIYWKEDLITKLYLFLLTNGNELLKTGCKFADYFAPLHHLFQYSPQWAKTPVEFISGGVFFRIGLRMTYRDIEIHVCIRMCSPAF